mgnify:CR=1 FL=1
MAGKIPRTQIDSIRRRDPIRLSPTSRLVDVVMTMKNEKRGAAIVEDNDGKLVGIVTEYDLRTKLDHSSLDWHSMTVEQVMITKPKTIKSSQYLHEALAIMNTCRFRHIPVVDDNNHVTGILSIRDIIMRVAKLYPQEFLNLPPDPHSEASGQYGG